MDYYEEYRLSFYKKLDKIQDSKEVYMVRHREDGMVYVLKYINKNSREIYEKIRELRLEHLPKIQEIIIQKDQLAVVEEYINGWNLRDYMEMKGPLSEAEAKKIVLILCDILEQIHGINPPIIHRDLKPSNIMIDANGLIYLIDFNVAKQYCEGKKEDTVLMGTEEFAAPEQYGFRQSDARTDIYGLGATINYLLTGKILKEEITDGVFYSIVKKCTMLDSESRYQSMHDLREAVKHVKVDEDSESAANSKEVVETADTKIAIGQKRVKDRVLWPWYKISGFLFLSLIWIWFCKDMIVTHGDQTPVTALEVHLNQFFMGSMGLGLIFLWFNVLHLRYRLPWMNKGKVLHLIGYVVYSILWVFSVIFLLAAVSGMLL